MGEVKKLFLFIVGTAALIVFLGFIAQGGLPENLLPQKDNSPKARIKGETFSLLLAQTLEERRQGLSGREKLEEKEGMLFIFEPGNVQPAFWMKDMRFSVDILWIDEGKIIEVNQNVPPEPGKTDAELTLYTPSEPIDYVLEVNAGTSEKYNFKVGDTVELEL